jgi:NAD(P)-dependent dehydrogenase (short-subunit alcohol dehydrogenase family)
MRLPDSVAIVTGGGSGIGRAICIRFADEGARVVAADRNLGGAEETVRLVEAAGGEALAIKADVTDAAAVARVVERAGDVFGPANVLVNNAAISEGDDVRTIDEATWDLNLAVVLKSAFLCTKAVLPGMIERRQGAIINIASVNGLTGLGEEPYSAAKAGMINLTKNLAIKYGRFNVRANVICPGSIRTPIWGARVAERPTIFDELAAWYPLGRVGEPEDVANAALFLASDEAAWITGAVLAVDGGLMAGSYRMARALAGDTDGA